MSDNKKYYYLKLKDNFFDSEEMKILESQKNGVEYQNLYLKLCLLSLKSEGKLTFKEYLPYDVTMLSTVLRVNIDTVKTGLEIFLKLGLLDMMETGLIYMTDIQSLIGKGSSEAERVKEYREKIKNDKSVQTYKKRTPEIEIEIEKELKIEKEQRKRFIPPSRDEIQSFTNENQCHINIDTFIDYYESNGWKIGKNKMSDWKATVRNWHRRDKENVKGKPAQRVDHQAIEDRLKEYER